MPSASILAATTMLRKPLEDLYAFAKGTAKTKLKALQAEKKLKELYKSIEEIQQVKTLWVYSKPIALTKFYYPSRIKIDKTNRQIDTISQISKNLNIVIEGTAGQGKSIFLRYLCMRELSLGIRIPIFFELRRLPPGKDFASFLCEVITGYGIDCDQELFECFADSGKIVLLADGFDEIDSEAVTSVVGYLEKLSQRFPNMQLVLTSRPDSGIQRSAAFHVFQLSPLQSTDHEGFLNKILGSKDKVRVILGAIRKSPAEIKSLLNTPLLLTLLVLVYNSTQEVPSTFAAFYQELFHTLLTRHDRSKPGYARRRATALADSDLKKIFEAFCYFARQEGRLVFTVAVFEQIFAKALVAASLETKPEDFIKDMTRTACVMLEEGFEYHFIHKSVAEFHAAAFIAHAADVIAKRFYTGMNNYVWMRWRQELTFLSEIDRSRYLRYYLIPTLQEDLQKYGVNLDQPFENLKWGEAKKALNKIEISVSRDVSDTELGIFEMSFRHTGHMGTQRGQDLFYKIISNQDNEQRERAEIAGISSNFLLGNDTEEHGDPDRLLEELNDGLRSLLSFLRKCEREVQQEQRVMALIDPEPHLSGTTRRRSIRLHKR